MGCDYQNWKKLNLSKLSLNLNTITKNYNWLELLFVEARNN